MSARLYGITLGFFALMTIALIARADDKDKPAGAAPAPATPADQAKMMEEYAKACAPGPEHAKLKEFAGDWDADVKMYNPDGTPQGNSKGVMHARMILGDRYIHLNYEGEMEMPTGKVPFHGMGIGGYDKGKKKYTSVWIDEMSTSMMHTEGTMDGNTMTCEGSCTDPMSGQPMKVKEISKQADKDHYSYELWMSGPDGKMMKVLEIAYTRKA
jgi:hypothetical protein